MNPRPASAPRTAPDSEPATTVAGGPDDSMRPEVAAIADRLPDRPILVIERPGRWLSLDLRDLWAHRDLFFFMVGRDVKVRYKQTALGVAWAVLQPVLTMVVFTVIFGRLAKVPSDGMPYPIFVFAGLLPWNFFNQAVTTSSNSLVGNAALITKVYFPRLVIPGAAVGAALVDFAISAAIMFAMAIYYGVALGAGLLMLIPLVLLITMFAAGVGMWMSALNVKFRDVRYALPFILQIWMYVTPIIYPVSFIPEHWRWLIALNPLSGIIQGFRCAIFGRPFDWTGLSISAALTVGVLIYAAFGFRRMEREFADII
jgi:homopolymeric O-antigen transport system permease protein